MCSKEPVSEAAWADDSTLTETSSVARRAVLSRRSPLAVRIRNGGWVTTASAAVSDGQLLGEVSAGSVEAFGALYDRYCDRAYRVALSVCRDDARAQDAVQEAFLSVWNSRRSYRSRRGTVAAWLLTIAHHRAIDDERKNGKHAIHRASEDELGDLREPDDVSEQVINCAESDRLQSLLALLPDVQREVITLAFYGQLSHAEIATQLGLPSGTVKGRMRLGLKKLHTNLEPGA
jgi:RNA polymerase sigma-70 factor (ECF subfamily)